MKLLYTIGVNLYVVFVHIFSLWNTKAKTMICGRKDSWFRLENFNASDKVYWFHCASLGEFEQGRPLIEALKKREDCQIIVTFFSPSGYEIRKNYELADLVLYLPKDSKKNAKRLIRLIQPSQIFFIKYEFWANYIFEAKSQNIPIYLVSGVFREDHIFFKWYGAFMRKILITFNTIFVQDLASQKLLKSINIQSVLSGDTRYDRVIENAQNVFKYPEIENFIGNKKVFIAGSVWISDMQNMGNTISNLDEGWIVIIAPHEIKNQNLEEIESYFKGASIRYSEIGNNNNKKCLIIDNIGMLMNLYQYADMAYIGGAFKTGLHNILEPASFGLPVIFGPKFSKFPEAYEFIEAEIGFSINNEQEFLKVFADLSQLKLEGKVSKHVESKRGATQIVLDMI